jgi:tetraacyldisaccharide 4'-kinase
MLFLIRIILLPLSLLYALGILLRNTLYDWKIFSITEFDIPIISIGNITIGGTGKTPHIDYLISLLKDKYQIAVLSRGYNRLSKGFQLINEKAEVSRAGDESRMLKNKFPDVMVAVDESRINGIHKLRELNPKLQVVLLDDAFQHRSVKAGLSIVLIDYNQNVFDDYLLPAGRLRENINALKRADIIIISKTPEFLKDEQRTVFINKLNLEKDQRIYFSHIKYGDLISLNDKKKAMPVSNFKEYDCILISGIAQSKPLEAFIQSKFKSFQHLKYRDHHHYTIQDIHYIKKHFDNFKNDKKLLLTTAKDAVKLKDYTEIKDLPFYYLPIEVKFQKEDAESFNEEIFYYLSK